MFGLVVVSMACLVGGDSPDLASSYEQRKATAGRDADSQVRLALWCEAHGLDRERLRHLALATMADPTNAMARGLLGLVEYRGKWRKPEEVAGSGDETALAELRADYDRRRLKTPVAADAQFQLADWCESKGLHDEARAHLATVVRLDPKRIDAREKLGYKKVGKRWLMTAEADAERAEADAQAEADRRWRPRLEAIRDGLNSKSRRPGAIAELAEVSDPRAVPMIGKVLVEGHEAHHASAVQVLGQVDAAASSRALASLALASPTEPVRRAATETLRRRDPREWADLAIAAVRPRIKYEVKPVGGPGSPGVLEIAGKDADTRRIYRPGELPKLAPGDFLSRDAQGRLVAVRGGVTFDTGMNYVNEYSPEMLAAVYHHSENNPTPHLNPETFSTLRFGAGPSGGVPYVETGQSPNGTLNGHGMNPFGQRSRLNIQGRQVVSIPIETMKADAERSAHVASEQLKADVAAIDRANDEVGRANARAVGLLAVATGLPFGDERARWEKWFVNQVGYALMTPTEKPTVVVNVPIDYQPTAVPITSLQITSATRMSCFGKGTPVRTVAGPRPIEDLKVGDVVLTQDTKTGRLGYNPVLVVHHNPPSATFRVDLDGSPVVASHFHRFWVAGKGWVMARDLKAGDPIRTLSGVARVTAVEPDRIQPVFNLDVASDADFFAGDRAALVHDNSLPDLRLSPFDASPAPAAR